MSHATVLTSNLDSPSIPSILSNVGRTSWTPCGMPSLDTKGREVSLFEFWPTAAFYFPVFIYWVWLSLRYRSVTLPTLANPFFHTGGLCGESKMAIYELVRNTLAEEWFVPHVSVWRTSNFEHDCKRALCRLDREEIAFPIVAKPDIGCRGVGVRLVKGKTELATYLKAFPVGETIVLQRYIADEGEAGVFYVRAPGARRGRVVSLTLKYLPCVVGDGCSTLKQLIMTDPRASRIPDTYFSRHLENLERVLPDGEVYRLSFVGNHCRGAIFRDGTRFVTDAMSARFDEIARAIPDFYFGRFDVRFRDLEDLQHARNFTILEVNGIGAEPIHIWDRKTKLIDAYRTIFAQMRLMYELGYANRKRAFRAMSVLELLWSFLRERRLNSSYPLSI